MTPIEAMAAGLPQVVSDWNGYRDTVRHGIDGFRVPTVMPPPGAGEELARRYYFSRDSYHEFTGCASQATAVDVGRCVEAFTELIGNVGLRRKMGDAARQRARECFDWAVIIKAYQELWRELARQRTQSQECAPRRPDSPPHPLHEDPFAAFAGYPTAALAADSTIRLSARRRSEYLRQMRDMPMQHETMLRTLSWLVKGDLIRVEQLAVSPTDARQLPG